MLPMIVLILLLTSATVMIPLLATRDATGPGWRLAIAAVDPDAPALELRDPRHHRRRHLGRAPAAAGVHRADRLHQLVRRRPLERIAESPGFDEIEQLLAGAGQSQDDRLAAGAAV